MNRSHWCLVFGVVAAASLLLCQSQALADDLLDASYTPVATAGTSAGAAHGACCQETCIPWEGCGCCGNHFYGSAEALFLAPIGSQRDACYEIDNARGRVLGHYDTDCVDNGGLIATPRITLGYQGECWGCEVRYRRMQEPTELNDLDHRRLERRRPTEQLPGRNPRLGSHPLVLLGRDANAVGVRRSLWRI